MKPREWAESERANDQMWRDPRRERDREKAEGVSSEMRERPGVERPTARERESAGG